ncbi:MAG: 16S rRNA (guanine(527)-N(7))-methyltransferase RsmG [Thiohalocapsa sp.]|jgi:16S rRNA (guanine527-N7)-methyltransferase|uniref:16S rRNA (guanine(527)-N(7))-methyltransferase RsmG n=1 Tax=Thiohalocapsa sp. TaxID=2497641 RepID=UPI0025D7836B|nr:16S rRNA (guanine(527)-N(7))-methyltransferase RsmG [Thiohalocapsa sp.]MCG6940922.1 16S rRNA (guanine(527)-N(7))-methyltransferase RsmG [Thiohalocapsa sp.]
MASAGTSPPPAADGPSALNAGLAALRIDAGEAQRAQLLAFIALLARWNLAYNLTAVRDPAEMVPRHLLDSLAVLPLVRRGPLLDVGTGPGLPGLPLAILRPELDFTLLDSNGKKIRFVRQAVLELELGNVTPVQARMQAYRPQVNFATITARAVAPLAALCAECAPLTAPGGVLLALKGRDPDAEVAGLAAAALPRVRMAAVSVHALQVPGLDAERSVIEVPFD